MQTSLKTLCVTTAILSGLALTQPSASWAQMTTVAKTVANNPNTAAKDAPDPRAFLDEIDGPEAMKWVLARNQTTLDRLSKDPRFAQNQAEALAILQATDRIAVPNFAHGGLVQNFWQDGEHTHGIWRQTTWDSYKTATPKWDTILDIDALSKAESKNWVWEGANCLAPDYTRCLIELSDGGKDATTVREFVFTTKRFIKGGFELP